MLGISIVIYDILPFQCLDKLNFEAVNLMHLYLQISSIFFSCWNYLIQKIQGNGISWKQRYIEFMVNSWDSVRISENRLTIYFIGKTVLTSFFISDYLLLLCLLWHCKSCYFCAVEASVMYSHAASSVPSICENEVSQGRFFSECWHCHLSLSFC